MDVWLLFGLVLPFVGFVLSILEELVHEDLEKVRKAGILDTEEHSVNIMHHNCSSLGCMILSMSLLLPYTPTKNKDGTKI